MAFLKPRWVRRSRDGAIHIRTSWLTPGTGVAPLAETVRSFAARNGVPVTASGNGQAPPAPLRGVTQPDLSWTSTASSRPGKRSFKSSRRRLTYRDRPSTVVQVSPASRSTR